MRGNKTKKRGESGRKGRGRSGKERLGNVHKEKRGQRVTGKMRGRHETVSERV